MNSRLLEIPLPQESGLRLQLLREHAGELPLYQRYISGDREGAWHELNELGQAVGQDPHTADCLAVAYETISRAVSNIDTIAARLRDLDYRFYSGATPRGGPVLNRPPSDAFEKILELEELAGPLALSLRAWFALSGQVELTGVHPTLSFIRGTGAEKPELERNLVFSDPLVLYGIDDALRCVRLAGALFISDCDSVKALAPDGGDAYQLIGTGTADCRITGYRNIAYRINFVDYLREVFEWGGFPGFAEEKWARFRPTEIAYLKADLLPI